MTFFISQIWKLVFNVAGNSFFIHWREIIISTKKVSTVASVNRWLRSALLRSHRCAPGRHPSYVTIRTFLPPFEPPIDSMDRYDSRHHAVIAYSSTPPSLCSLARASRTRPVPCLNRYARTTHDVLCCSYGVLGSNCFSYSLSLAHI